MLHNQLRRAWLGDAVKKALGVHTSTEGGLERYGETLTPVMNPWGMPEWAALRGEQLCAVRSFVAGVAAEYGGVALMNPAASNSIVVVEAVSILSGAAEYVYLEIGVDTLYSGTYLTLTNPSCARDRRFKGLSGLSRATFRQGTDLSNTFGAQLEQSGTNTGFAPNSFTTSLPVILRPGDSLAVIGQTVNTSLTVSWGWRERVAFPGELA